MRLPSLRAIARWPPTPRERYGLRGVAYVLMPNHVHLLVRVGEVPLGRAMQFVQGRFARRYNRQYGHTGHLFQGRYGVKLCDDERYLWALVRYIHANPVRAGVSKTAEGYRWSSLREYATERWKLVSEEEARRLLGRPDREALAGV